MKCGVYKVLYRWMGRKHRIGLKCLKGGLGKNRSVRRTTGTKVNEQTRNAFGYSAEEECNWIKEITGIRCNGIQITLLEDMESKR